jgi:hypothetical protein
MLLNGIFTMSLLRHCRVWMVVVFCLGCLAASARADESLADSRPCGPDSLRGPLRWLIPQGAFGADFRPACRAHDACYDTLGANRAECDARFLSGMLRACESSRRPCLCRMTARLMYRVTAKRGADSFAAAQRQASRRFVMD